MNHGHLCETGARRRAVLADGRVHGEADAWKAANEGGPRVEGGQGRGVPTVPLLVRESFTVCY